MAQATGLTRRREWKELWSVRCLAHLTRRHKTFEQKRQERRGKRLPWARPRKRALALLVDHPPQPSVPHPLQSAPHEQRVPRPPGARNRHFGRGLQAVGMSYHAGCTRVTSASALRPDSGRRRAGGPRRGCRAEMEGGPGDAEHWLQPSRGGGLGGRKALGEAGVSSKGWARGKKRFGAKACCPLAVCTLGSCLRGETEANQAVAGRGGVALLTGGCVAPVSAK
ncbi:hypothetical protein B0J12DRAFT_424903 [Macrophomina phaseolina]|uniref:Uncharacterized protein n=1 Tax=Macrophomina phaseolina TaxID=35725 RepID=A0ABQ8GJL7_9PEZI|nr:hypothetical protein B0J12DRAFT_424903 [Macrophomina phaseolina]